MKVWGITLLVILLIILFTGTFTVQEGEAALLLKLGKLKKDASQQVRVYSPGLHVKWPLVEDVVVFDTRLQTLDTSTSRIGTAEKKDVIVDYYVKWRITNLPLYYTRTSGNEQTAGVLLQQQLNDSIRAQFGKRTINEVVSDERSKIMDALLAQANVGTQALGISVVDVRIKRIDLPTEVSAAVFNRMRAERERVATEHRSMGKAAAEAIRAGADANVTLTLANANAQAADIKGQGTAQAARIYADAYNKDPGFYAFYRSLLAYQQTFQSKDDILVLRPNSHFFRYFDNTKD
jgi:membrane protease subunit HflC